uniref:Replicase n=1 Tax=Agaricus bisporus virus 7 TaxID=1945751 RepID=A0A1Q1N6H4_9VIRU|nr:replicase [Agaricus bisporus virus 7]
MRTWKSKCPAPSRGPEIIILAFVLLGFILPLFSVSWVFTLFVEVVLAQVSGPANPSWLAMCEMARLLNSFREELGLLWFRSTKSACWTRVVPTCCGGAFMQGFTQHRHSSDLIDSLRMHHIQGCRKVQRFYSVSYTGRGLWHITVNPHPGSKLIRWNKLPRGMYGADMEMFTDSPQRNAVLSPNVDRYLVALRNAVTQCPYNVTGRMRRFLVRAGISEPAEFSPNHPHPVHVALETQMLSFVRGMLNGYNWFGLFINPNKLSGWQEPAGLYNPLVTAKDFNRYKDTLATQKFTGSNARVWFMHDALQYFSASEIGGWFDEYPSLDHLICTIVAPTETLHRIGSAYPDLYKLRYKGRSFQYTPEGDSSGAYWQPIAGSQWPLARRLITPGNKCVHVGVVHSRYAHHVVMISRKEFGGSLRVSPDLPDLVYVPRWVLPFSSMADRATTVKMLEKLSDYSCGLEKTNWRDLYQKLRQFQMVESEMYPSNYKVAAASYVLARRCLQLVWHESALSAGSFFISILFSLPFISFSWAWASLTYSLSGPLIDLEAGEDTNAVEMVSAPSDKMVLNSEVCRVVQVRTHYVPPNATSFERVWIRFASTQVLLVSKLFGVVLPELWPHLHWASMVRTICERLEIWWGTPLIAVLCFILSSWWNFDCEDGIESLTKFGQWFSHWSRFLAHRGWALMWGLPSSPWVARVGHTRRYRALFLWAWMTGLWPSMFRPIPGVRILLSHPAGIIALLVLFSLALLPTPSRMFRSPRPLLPSHFAYTEIVDVPDSEESETSENGTENSDGSSPSNSTATGRFPGHLTPSSSSEAESVVGVVVEEPLPLRAPPTVPVPRPVEPIMQEHVEPAPPTFVQPRQRLDRFAQYRMYPMAFNSSVEFAAAVSCLPVPEVFPAPRQMCVWDCLGLLFNVDPVLLWAVFCAHYPNVAPEGSVPENQLTTVFTLFRCSGTVDRATEQDGHPVRNATVPQLVYGVAVDGWPTFAWSLIQLPGQNAIYHLVTEPATESLIAAPLRMPVLGALVGFNSRFVGLGEMRFALNYPSRVFQRIYQSFTGFAANPAWGAAVAATELEDPGYQAPGLPPAVELPSIPLRGEEIRYQFTAQDLADARALADDIKRFPSETLITDSSAAQLCHGVGAILDHAVPRSLDMVLFHGMYGTGKTTRIIREIQNLLDAGVHAQDICVVSPTPVLSEETARAVMAQVAVPKHCFVVTYKVLVSGARYVFFDEAGKYHPGFIPLVCHNNIHMLRATFTFDAAQGSSIFEKPGCKSRQNVRTSRWLSALSNHYATEVRRSSRQVCQLFGVPGQLATTDGEVRLVTQQPRDVPLLVASPRYAEGKNHAGVDTFSFNDCQGLTMDGDVAVDLGGMTTSSSDGLMWTALGRARGSIWLVMSQTLPSTSTIQEQSYGTSLIVSAILAVAAVRQSPVINARQDLDDIVKRAVQSHLAASLSPAAARSLGLNPPQPVIAGVESNSAVLREGYMAWLQDNQRIATARTFARTTHVAGRPKPVPGGLDRVRFVAHTLRHYLPLANDTKVKTEETTYTAPRRTYAQAVVDPLFEWSKRPRAPEEERGFQDRIEPTHVRDAYGPQEAQQHKSNDETLIALSIAERCPPRRDNPTLSAKDVRRLQQLKTGFKKSFNFEKMEFNELVAEDCFAHCVKSWANGKSKARLINSVSKWEVDHPPEFIKLFSKGQWVKKLGARGADVKKSQIIAEVALSTVFADAVYAEYMERMISLMTPKSTLYYSRMNPGQLREWYTDNWTPSAGVTANDYTAWDSGMDRVFLAFDLWLMRSLSLPESYVQMYINRKVNSRTRVGPYPIMQPSGDRYTYFLNSMRNAAVIGASLSFKRGTAIAVGGDDSIICGRHGSQRSFNPRQWKISPKLERGKVLPFCGWSFGSRELSLSLPELAYRIHIGVQRGVRDKDYWRSMCELLREAGDDELQLSEVRTKLAAVQRYLCDISDLVPAEWR